MSIPETSNKTSIQNNVNTATYQTNYQIVNNNVCFAIWYLKYLLKFQI